MGCEFNLTEPTLQV